MNKRIPVAILCVVISGALLVRFFFGQTEASATISPEKGGQLVRNGARLVIGPNALAQTRHISLGEANHSASMKSEAAALSLTNAGPVWHFESVEPLLLQPAELILPYREQSSEIRNVEKILAARWDGRRWLPVKDGFVDTSARQIHIPVSVLSDYAVFYSLEVQPYPLLTVLRENEVPEYVRASLPVRSSGTTEHWTVELRGKGPVPPLLIDRLSFSMGYILDRDTQSALSLVLSERIINQRTLREGQAMLIEASSLSLARHRLSPVEGDDLPKLAAKVNAVALLDQIGDLNARFAPSLANVVSQANDQRPRLLVSKVKMASDVASGTIRNGWLFFLPTGEAETWNLKESLVFSIRIDPANDRPPFNPGVPSASNTSVGTIEITASASPVLDPSRSGLRPSDTPEPTSDQTTDAAQETATATPEPNLLPTATPIPKAPGVAVPSNPTVPKTPTGVSSPTIAKNPSPTATGRPTRTVAPSPSPSKYATPTATPKKPTNTPKKPTNTPIPTDTPKEPTRTLRSTSTATPVVFPTNTRWLNPTATPTKKRNHDDDDD